MYMKIKEMYENGDIELSAIGRDNDYVSFQADSRRLVPSPVRIDVLKADYKLEGEDACIKKLAQILSDDESIKLF